MFWILKVSLPGDRGVAVRQLPTQGLEMRRMNRSGCLPLRSVWLGGVGCYFCFVFKRAIKKGFCFINFIDFGYYIRNCEHLRIFTNMMCIYWLFVYTCIYTVCIDCVYIQWVPVILLQMCTLSFDWRTICWSKSLIGRPILSTLRDLKHRMLKLRASWVFEGVWLMGVKTRTETGWLEGWWKANVVF